MPDHTTDEQFLRQALNLARQGVGLASPSPYVGAVIVDSSGSIAGTGVYTYESVKHAEIRALEEAGARARGGTLYINLEPHSHLGRTSPCTDALINAGICRVVSCMADPNPKVSGHGFEKLREARVRVEVGGLEAEARKLNEAFARHIRHGVPLITLKSAMTLDGKIAPARSEILGRAAGAPPGGWITGDAARANVQQQRHQSDAVMVGVGTILADDPLLTDRSGNPRRRPLLRVILDSHLRIPLESRLVQSAASENTSGNDVLVFCASPDQNTRLELEARGVRVEQVSRDSDGHPNIHAVLRRLGELEIISVMIEGGSTVNGAVLAAGAVDKVFLYYTPKIMGNEGAVPFVRDVRLSLNTTPLLENAQFHHFRADFAVEGYLRDPYED
jgi:diaminohydroxyphosphoribosylaminopyrimidine deaminase/5-amino-6-(5-phosphoribosylamino)uracil reductase